MTQSEYYVVFETIVGEYKGVRTRTCYRSKEHFDECMQHPNMKSWYKIVAEGVTDEEAERLVMETHVRNTNAFVGNMIRTILGS